MQYFLFSDFKGSTFLGVASERCNLSLVEAVVKLPVGKAMINKMYNKKFPLFFLMTSLPFYNKITLPTPAPQSVPYTTTPIEDNALQPGQFASQGNMSSISAMPEFSDYSFEELRFSQSQHINPKVENPEELERIIDLLIENGANMNVAVFK